MKHKHTLMQVILEEKKELTKHFQKCGIRGSTVLGFHNLLLLLNTKLKCKKWVLQEFLDVSHNFYCQHIFECLFGVFTGCRLLTKTYICKSESSKYAY